MRFKKGHVPAKEAEHRTTEEVRAEGTKEQRVLLVGEEAEEQERAGRREMVEAEYSSQFVKTEALVLKTFLGSAVEAEVVSSW